MQGRQAFRRASAGICDDGVMPRLIPTNPIAAGFVALKVWRRLSPTQRRLLLDAARTHGPRVAMAAAAAAKARRKR